MNLLEVINLVRFMSKADAAKINQAIEMSRHYQCRHILVYPENLNIINKYWCGSIKKSVLKICKLKLKIEKLQKELNEEYKKELSKNL